MNKPRVLLIGIKGNLLQTPEIDIPDMMKEALGAEKRIIKGINPDSELRRMYLYNDRITSSLLRIIQTSETKNRSYCLGDSYLDVMRTLFEYDPEKAVQLRLGAGFYPVAYLKKHLKEFEDFVASCSVETNADVVARITFFKQAIKQNLTVFEILDGFSQSRDNSLADNTNLSELLDELSVVYGDKTDVSDEIVDIQGVTQEERLSSQIISALEQTRNGKLTKVSFSAQRNDVIAEVLRMHLYHGGIREGLPLTYSDGSEAFPFPVNALRPRSEQELAKLHQLPILRMGLLSERHQELDNIVYKYWFRNQEVSTGKPHGEIDTFCYELSKEIFESLRDEGMYRIAMFQTGLEPANIGFYRALAEELIFRSNQQPTLEVIPYYFTYEGLIEGKPWN